MNNTCSQECAFKTCPTPSPMLSAEKFKFKKNWHTETSQGLVCTNPWLVSVCQEEQEAAQDVATKEDLDLIQGKDATNTQHCPPTSQSLPKGRLDAIPSSNSQKKTLKNGKKRTTFPIHQPIFLCALHKERNEDHLLILQQSLQNKTNNVSKSSIIKVSFIQKRH